jgi:TolB-like protein
LIEAGWPELAVEEGNLTVQIAAVRRVLGQAPGGENWIETLPRRGYRYIGPVGAVEDESSVAVPTTEATPARSARPSIAVLPFQNLSGDPEQEYFADGVVEEIITGLARIEGLLVIARNSSFTYKGKVVDVKQIGRELGASYVLEGSVRKAGGRVRVSARLVEAETGAHLWAERYDRELENIFKLQDEITLSVVGAVEPNLLEAEIERVKRKRPDSLDAGGRGAVSVAPPRTPRSAAYGKIRGYSRFRQAQSEARVMVLTDRSAPPLSSLEALLGRQRHREASRRLMSLHLLNPRHLPGVEIATNADQQRWHFVSGQVQIGNTVHIFAVLDPL